LLVENYSISRIIGELLALFSKLNLKLIGFGGDLEVALDRVFLEKISNSQNGINYFICVSPNINDKRNARLDMFFRYFNENFDTDLISSRADDVQNYKRYEKIFKVEL